LTGSRADQALAFGRRSGGAYSLLFLEQLHDVGAIERLA
jgi:hypothetical protein